MKTSGIRTEGGLIPADLLEAIATAEAEGQVTVEPQLPADLLGIYLLLPVPRMK